MYSENGQEKEKLSQMIRNKIPRRKIRIFQGLEEEFQKYTTFISCMSVLFVLLGLIFIVWPMISLKVFGILYGILFLIQGIIQILFFLKRKEMPIFRYAIFFGIIYLLYGGLFCFLPLEMSRLMTILIGVWFLFDSVTLGIFAFSLFKMKDSGTMFFTVSAILLLFLGILILLDPFANLTFAELFGIFLVLKGVLMFTDNSLLKKRASNILSHLE